MKPFGYLRDPLFLVCVGLYGLNRFAEHCGLSHWLLRYYLNDLVCLPFWLPILIWLMRRLGLRSGDRPPEKSELATAFVVWSVMFEVWLPSTELLGQLSFADPWDIVCYAAGGVFAGLWWDHYYAGSAAGAGQPTGAKQTRQVKPGGSALSPSVQSHP